MACVTNSLVSASAIATTARPSASNSRSCFRVLPRPTYRPAGFRVQQLSRSNLAKAINAGCWGPAGVCGPQKNYRRWTSGPNTQPSFNKWAEQASNNMWFPVDVIEEAQQYTFVADIPGLGKNDIKVCWSTRPCCCNSSSWLLDALLSLAVIIVWKLLLA